MLIGQPADLIKIRLQTSSETSSLSIIKHVLKNEGVFAFYKGTLAPLFGVGVCVSLQFYGFHEAKRQLLKNHPGELNLWPQTYLAGAFAGIVNTPVSAPVEQLRILSQASSTNTKSPLIGTVKKIYKDHGLRSGIFRGFGITLVREVQAYGIWFLTYETLIKEIIDLQHYKSRDQVSTPELLAAGALAGNALWLLSYPIDVVKSNIQSDGFGKDSKFNGDSLKVVKWVFREHGFRGFWRGIVPCLLRAVPCSAGTFAAVELALRVMG